MELRSWSLILILGFLWGSSFLFVELLLEALTPFSIVYLRVLIASLIFLVFLIIIRPRFQLTKGVILSLFFMATKILMRHALRNAAVPIVTVIGLGIALLIGGVVVTESVYNIPGLGRLVLDAVLARDYPIIQGLILFFSLVYVLLNLLIDLAYTFFDPRIKY